MIALIWVLSLLTFLVTDVKTGPSQDKETERLHCYTCGVVDNATDCQQQDDLPQVKCPPELPYCGTIAKSPDYISSLACSVGSSAPCTLIQTAKDTYEMTCTCDGHVCNKPFAREFQNELLNFSPTNLPDNTTSGLLEMFMNSSSFGNVTSAKLYDAVTVTLVKPTTRLNPVPPTPIPLSTVVRTGLKKSNSPQAEALKQEATVPSDDDEDEGEGSGSFEDVKSQAPAAPAAPSSFLPANENAAYPVHINLLTTIPFLSLYIVA